MKSELFNLIRLIYCGIMMLVFKFKNKYYKLNNKNFNYKNFHSQFGEDRYIFEKIELPQKGVFVDIGAGHPIFYSNTYFFEKNGLFILFPPKDEANFNFLKDNLLA